MIKIHSKKILKFDMKKVLLKNKFTQYDIGLQ